MKRMHIHSGVENLDQSINFYSALFGAQPVKAKIDYAKWMLMIPLSTLSFLRVRARQVSVIFACSGRE